MAATMSRNTRDEFPGKMRGRDARTTGRKARGKLRDEFCEVTGLESTRGGYHSILVL